MTQQRVPGDKEHEQERNFACFTLLSVGAVCSCAISKPVSTGTRM